MTSTDLWLSFHGVAFTFPREHLTQFSYITNRLARWEGKKDQSIGKTRENPLSMTILSLARFARVYDLVTRGGDATPDEVDDMRLLGIDVPVPTRAYPQTCDIRNTDKSAAMGLSAAISKSKCIHSMAVEKYAATFTHRSALNLFGIPTPDRRQRHILGHGSICIESKLENKPVSFSGPYTFGLGYADILSTVTLEVTLPALPNGCHWVESIVMELLHSATLQRHTNPSLITLTGLSNNILAHAHQKRPHADMYYRQLDDAEKYQRSATPWQFTIPLMFPMTCRKDHAIPVASLIGGSNMKFNCKITLATLSHLVRGNLSDSLKSTLQPTVMLMANTALVEDLAILTQNPLVRPWFRLHRIISAQSLAAQYTFECFAPSTGLVMACYSVDDKVMMDMAAHPFSKCELHADGHTLMVDYAERMRTWQWQYCGLAIPPTHVKWYLLPFSPDMFTHMPSSVQALNRMNLSLRFEPNSTLTSHTWSLDVFSLEHTLLLFSSGACMLRYEWDHHLIS